MEPKIAKKGPLCDGHAAGQVLLVQLRPFRESAVLRRRTQQAAAGQLKPTAPRFEERP